MPGAPSQALRSRLVGYALLLAGMAVVGSYVALSGALLASFPVFVLAGLRFALGALMLLPWTRRRAHEAMLDAAARRALFLQSLFGNFLFSLCMLGGMARTPATLAGVVLAALPAVVALASRVVLRERGGARLWSAVLLAVGGVALSTLAAPGNGPLRGFDAIGLALLAGCLVCEAIYVVLGKRLGPLRSPLRLSALLNLWGLALMAPLALWQARDFDVTAVTPGAWQGLILYAAGASVVSTTLWLAGLRRVPAAHSGVCSVGLPLAATAVGVLVYGEPFGSLQALALGLAVVAIAVIAWPTRSQEGDARARRI